MQRFTSMPRFMCSRCSELIQLQSLLRRAAKRLQRHHKLKILQTRLLPLKNQKNLC